MRRVILYAGAATFFLSLLTTVLAITTYQVSAPPCPWCHASNAAPGTKFDTATSYTCRSCDRTFYGPPRMDFSWAAAVEDWLDDSPVVK